MLKNLQQNEHQNILLGDAAGVCQSISIVHLRDLFLLNSRRDAPSSTSHLRTWDGRRAQIPQPHLLACTLKVCFDTLQNQLCNFFGRHWPPQGSRSKHVETCGNLGGLAVSAERKNECTRPSWSWNMGTNDETNTKQHVARDVLSQNASTHQINSSWNCGV